jgi:hypothetical protein
VPLRLTELRTIRSTLITAFSTKSKILTLLCESMMIKPLFRCNSPRNTSRPCGPKLVERHDTSNVYANTAPGQMNHAYAHQPQEVYAGIGGKQRKWRRFNDQQKRELDQTLRWPWQKCRDQAHRHLRRACGTAGSLCTVRNKGARINWPLTEATTLACLAAYPL